MPITKIGLNKKFWPLLALILIAVLTTACVYLYLELTSLKANPQQQIDNEAEDLINKVSELIILPTDEQPTIATVSDPGLLAGQEFFARAQAGDKVLIYTQAKKAILYNPTAHKIVEVAPVNLGEDIAATQPEAVTGLEPEVAGEQTESEPVPVTP